MIKDISTAAVTKVQVPGNPGGLRGHLKEETRSKVGFLVLRMNEDLLVNVATSGTLAKSVFYTQK